MDKKSTQRFDQPAATPVQFTIGALAKAADVGVETIRYYQRRGLLREPQQTRGAYRVYGEAELARLTAIRRAQQLGFSLDEIDGLLALNEERDRDRAREAAQAKIELIESRIRQLQDMRDALAELVHCCEHTDAPAPCPILRALSTA
ncbi:MAG: MerR family transcriptional regulator [Thauera sp.]|nr:MerR family transcriptional regulator [Thauera sp.]